MVPFSGSRIERPKKKPRRMKPMRKHPPARVELGCMRARLPQPPRRRQSDGGEVHLLQDCIETRLAAQRIEPWIDLNADQTSVADGEGVLEGRQGPVVIAQLRVDAAILVTRRLAIKLLELR